jgi:hypothetical protein
MMRLFLVCAVLCAAASTALAQDSISYRVVATNKTSTMQKEMQEAGDAGFRFAGVMGGETTFGGKEVVVVMQKSGASSAKFEYRLLATNRTTTMQEEMQDAGDAGFTYVGQTVFESLFGGKEVASIFERDVDAARKEKYEYKLLATNKTSTLQKELQEAGDAGFQMIGMTVGKTLVGGNEIVSILRRPLP